MPKRKFGTISSMKNISTAQQYSAQHFKGPLDLLIALIYKGEIDVFEVFVNELVKQYQTGEIADLDEGAEFINDTSLLIWLKSKSLLPLHERMEEEIEGELPLWEMIPQLIDYCRFKEVGKVFVAKEQEQSAFYCRGDRDPIELKKKYGIDHLTLDDFASLFKQLVSKASVSKRVISPEEWKISDAIALVRNLLESEEKIKLSVLFSPDKCREEMIVAFLAILELMKSGAIALVRFQQSEQVYIIKKVYREDVERN